MREVIGGCLVAVPFVALFVCMVKMEGWLLALSCLFGVAVTVGCFYAGCKLLG